MEEKIKIILKMVYGSHLYGTNTLNSDKDYKGIFMPSKEQIFLGKIPKSYNEQTGNDKSKNTAKDVDTEMYSLHYFLKLACEGQTVALDMLHAPDNMILETSDIWREIVKERHRFYTKNMNAFVGYARRQAAKYGIKGSRLADAKKVLDILEEEYEVNKNDAEAKKESKIRIKWIWAVLPEGEHIDKTGRDIEGNRIYEICGKKIQETATIGYLYNVVKKFYKSYGERAKQAEQNLGINWKAVSHALRVAYQTKQILTEKKITYPLKEAIFLKQVKAGKFNYLTLVAPLLESLMTEVKTLAEVSTLPVKTDIKFWDNFIIDEIEDYYRIGERHKWHDYDDKIGEDN